MEEIKRRVQRTFLDFGKLCLWVILGLFLGLITALFEFIYAKGLDLVLDLHARFNPWILIFSGRRFGL